MNIARKLKESDRVCISLDTRNPEQSGAGGRGLGPKRCRHIVTSYHRNDVFLSTNVDWLTFVTICAMRMRGSAAILTATLHRYRMVGLDEENESR